MANEYALIPRATTAPFEPVVVALVGGTTKTVLQLAVPSTTDVLLLGWSVSFDGASGTAVPVICHLMDGDVAATVTAMTPEVWGHSSQPASLCVSGTAASGYNASAEGTLTTIRMIDAGHVHPQAGYGIMLTPPLVSRVAPSRFVRIRCRAPAAVNVIPELFWAEPAI